MRVDIVIAIMTVVISAAQSNIPVASRAGADCWLHKSGLVGQSLANVEEPACVTQIRQQTLNSLPPDANTATASK